MLEDLGRQLQDGIRAAQDASVGAVGEVEVEEAVRDGRFQEQVRLRLRAMLEPVQIDDLENGLFDMCRYRYTVLSRGHGWVRWVLGLAPSFRDFFPKQSDGTGWSRKEVV